MTAAAATRPVAIASAGIGVVGVSFGMARYGFGLLAPDIRATFGLGSGALGLLAAASYVAYLATSVTAGVLTERLGPRAIVASGGLCAVIGMVVAGVAQSPPVLFAGLLVAGASAGLVFPPLLGRGGSVPARREAPTRAGRHLLGPRGGCPAPAVARVPAFGQAADRGGADRRGQLRLLDLRR